MQKRRDSFESHTSLYLLEIYENRVYLKSMLGMRLLLLLISDNICIQTNVSKYWMRICAWNRIKATDKWARERSWDPPEWMMGSSNRNAGYVFDHQNILKKMNSPFVLIVPGYPMVTDFNQIENTRYELLSVFEGLVSSPIYQTPR